MLKAAPYRALAAGTRGFAPTPLVTRSPTALRTFLIGAVVLACWAFHVIRDEAGLLIDSSVALVIVGVVLMICTAGTFMRWRRTRELKLSAVSEANDGLVNLRGRIQPTEDGMVTTPLRARGAVWAHVIVQEIVDEALSVRVDETAAHDFLLDDGSGPIAHVLVSRAMTVFPSRRFQWVTHPKRVRPPDPLVEFVESRSGPWRYENGYDVEERSLEPGMTVTVIGRASRSGNRIIVEADAASGSELIVCDGVLPPVSYFFIAGIILVLVGLFLGVIAAARALRF